MANHNKRNFFAYSEESMKKAIAEVEKGAKIRETYRNFGIPRATLQDRLKGRVSQNRSRKMGPDPYLSVENEKKLLSGLLTWQSAVSQINFDCTKNCSTRRYQNAI